MSIKLYAVGSESFNRKANGLRGSASLTRGPDPLTCVPGQRLNEHAASP